MQSGHFFVVITKIIYVFRNRAEIRYCRRQLGPLRDSVKKGTVSGDCSPKTVPAGSCLRNGWLFLYVHFATDLLLIGKVK